MSKVEEARALLIRDRSVGRTWVRGCRSCGRYADDNGVVHHFRDCAGAALLALVEAMAEATEWRGMDDVPADGVEVLGLDPLGVVAVVSRFCGIWLDNYREGPIDIVAWLPLPAPPAPEEL